MCQANVKFKGVAFDKIIHSLDNMYSLGVMASLVEFG
jgi:hypothetical protein